MPPDREAGRDLTPLERAVVRAVAAAIVRQLRRDVGRVPAVWVHDQRQDEQHEQQERKKEAS